MLGLPFVEIADANWNELVADLTTLYKQSFAPSESDLMFVRVPFVERAMTMLAAATPTTEPNLSNLGIIDDFVQKEYGQFLIKNVWLAVRMLSPQLYIHSWSWDGNLNLSICYNVAFYEEEFVQKWLEEVRENLLNNLGVSS
jgi:hypothetical protein